METLHRLIAAPLIELMLKAAYKKGLSDALEVSRQVQGKNVLNGVLTDMINNVK